MQYFKPEGDFFVGDCMPFFHDGTFHMFYLLDENHHAALGGLGGHQWAHATTTDLIHWTHHPLAIGITHEWEGSICTGSTFFHDGTYYGFYASRLRDWTQHLSVATSTDGIHFQKREPNPYASPPAGYNPLDYRDPFVFWDESTQQFHMLVTASLQNYPIHNQGGCLAHLVSTDLKTWAVQEPFLLPGLPGVPECSDYFYWNGWYYLIFSNGLIAHYRMAREPFGPWLRPEVDSFDAGAAWVMKTAAFTNGRRIGGAFIPSREGHKDASRFLWGGNMVIREVIQHEDGSLGTKFPAELTSATGEALIVSSQALTSGVTVAADALICNAPEGLAMAKVDGMPRNGRIRLHINPGDQAAEFGLHLRGEENARGAYRLRFLPYERRVELFDQAITAVDGLDKPFTLDIVLKDDIIDVCIDERRCIVNRCPEAVGSSLFFYTYCAAVTFEAINITQIS